MRFAVSGAECEEDAHRLCPGIMKSCIGSFGCTIQCLTDHAPKVVVVCSCTIDKIFREPDRFRIRLVACIQLSPACRSAHPCYPDIDKYCVEIPAGKNEMMKYAAVSSLIASAIHGRCRWVVSSSV